MCVCAPQIDHVHTYVVIPPRSLEQTLATANLTDYLTLLRESGMLTQLSGMSGVTLFAPIQGTLNQLRNLTMKRRMQREQQQATQPQPIQQQPQGGQQTQPVQSQQQQPAQQQPIQKQQQSQHPLTAEEQQALSEINADTNLKAAMRPFAAYHIVSGQTHTHIHCGRARFYSRSVVSANLLFCAWPSAVCCCQVLSF